MCTLHKQRRRFSPRFPPALPLCVPPLLRVSLPSPRVFPVSPDLLPVLGGLSPERMW